MKIGIVMMVLGLVITPYCRTFATMLLFFGIILPSGTGAVSFGIVMSAITPPIGERKAASVSGIVQASAGIGDALMSPVLQGFITWRGIAFSMNSFAVLMFAVMPVVIWIGAKNRELNSGDRSETSDTQIPEEKTEHLWTIIQDAFRDLVYRKVFLGFSACGFNMSIIESHLFSQYVSWGIEETAASLVMTVYGILTMIGAVAAGFLGGKFQMKNVLGSVYFIRVIISVSMLFVPHTLGSALILTGFLGATGDSTVPPTNGIITRRFGTRKMAVIYGFALIGHQVGAFLSSWFGGFCAEHLGSYYPLWIANMALSLIVAITSWSIHEENQNLTRI